MQSQTARAVATPFTTNGIMLAVNNVSKVFGKHAVLRDVNFEIPNIHREGMEQGQVWSILGGSGKGKTTLCKIIAGLIEPTTGEVRVGKDNRPIEPGEVGFVFQNYLGFDHLTVRDYMTLSAYQGVYGPLHLKDIMKRQWAWWAKRGEFWDRASYYIDMFQLTEHVDKYLSELSGGQQQRAAIVSQILCSSRYIVFDEPFSSQDPEKKHKACKTLIKVAQLDEKQTLLVITHDIRGAVWVSDTLLPLGVEKDGEGREKPGSTVFQPYSLAERGLAWRDESILRTPEFNELVQEIEFEWFPNM